MKPARGIFSTTYNQLNDGFPRKSRIYVPCACRLATTNLALGQRPHPAKSKVEYDDDYANNPEGLGVVGAVVAEDDSEDNTAEVARRTDKTGKDTFLLVSYAVN
jgi:hypothetical protein